jgi:thiol-disulfide isomerase/thioredoxin
MDQPSPKLRLAAMAATAMALLAISVPFVWQHDVEAEPAAAVAETPDAVAASFEEQDGAACMANAKPAKLDFTIKDLDNKDVSLASFKGKVILLNFWATWCGPCLASFPHLKEWHEKYKDKGLTVVGVHTPEFAFEKSTKNVKDAVQRLQIKHAVAQDNSYGTWKAFNNQYWPAVYLIDKQGRIVYSHFGEGSYGTTEKKIQALLAEPFTAPSGNLK